MESGEYYLHLYTTSEYKASDEDWRYSDVAEAVGRVTLDDNDRFKHAEELGSDYVGNGEIHYEGDVDWWRFEVPSGIRNKIIIETTGATDTLGILAHAYRGQGYENWHTGSSDDDSGEGLNFRLETYGNDSSYGDSSGQGWVQYVRVSHSSLTGLGDYTLRVTGISSPDLVVDSLSTNAREVDPGERFTLSATVRNRGDARSRATAIRYYRTTGSRDILLGTSAIRALAPSGTASDNFRARAETAPGTYTYKACAAEVSGESNTSNNCGSPVDVRVRQPSGGDDHGDSRSNATRVSLPSRTSGEIDPGDDEDYFRFEVSRRSAVLARTTGNLDTVGALYDSTGNELATNDDGGTSTNFRIRRELDAGTYYVRVSSYYTTGTGAYTLDLSIENASGDVDDHGDSRSNATHVSLPSQMSGEIDPGDDEDYFRFEVSQRGAVLVRSTGDLDTIGSLYDSTGNEVATNDDGGTSTNFRIRRELDAGTYYVRVSSFGTGTGAYTLHLSIENASGGGSTDDHSNSRPNATRVSLPSRTSGEIDPGNDEDYFRFEVSQRGAVLVRSTGNLDTVGTLYDSTGNEVATNDDGGTSTNFRIQRELAAGTYYVRVSSYYTTGTGAYTLHLSIEGGTGGGSPDLVVDLLSTNAREVGPGEQFTLSATVRNRGDARSSATTVRYYRTTGGRDTLLGTSAIRALAPSGTASDDFRVRAETAPGTYTYKACAAEISGELNTSNNCGSSVDVRVRQPSGSDHGDSRSNATHVSLPSLTSGEINPGGNEDYFRFEVSRLSAVLARTTGGIDTVGTLYDSTGNEVATNDDDGTGFNFRIQRELAAGTYYVRVSSFGTGTGAYTLHLSIENASGGDGDHGGSRSDATRVSLPSQTSGEIDPGNDDDYFRFEVSGRGTVLAHTTGSLDTVGVLYDSTGNELATNDDGGTGRNFRIRRELAAGTYYVRVSSYGTRTGAYTLHLSIEGGTGVRTSGIPVAGPAIPEQSLETGGDATLDLSAYFSDDQTLVYEVLSSDTEVLRVSVTGSVLTLTPVAEGSAKVMVTARDPDGNTATQTFTLTVGAATGSGSGGRAGETFQDCAECPEMVVVPSGTFQMGAPESEEASRSSERPVHTVSVPSFAVGVYEVTFAEWDACVAAGGCFDSWQDDEGWGRGRRPVMNVSWADAQSYVEWLSGRTGHRYRLLSESEWEYAARAGTTGPFHTGSTISTDQANYDGFLFYPPAYNPNSVNRRQTLPVGSFPANGFGLHDVHGNVRELVQDCWNASYTDAPSDGSAWESGDCFSRVTRGGSWGGWAPNLRSATRVRIGGTGYRRNTVGFRVARTLTP